MPFIRTFAMPARLAVSAVTIGLLDITGHHLCSGRIPEWTAHVGQRWDTYDVAPWNLYNSIWRGQQLLMRFER